MSADLDCYRSLFPVTERYLYVNHAAFGPVSLRAAEAARQVLDEAVEQGGVPYGSWVRRVEDARQFVSRLLGAGSSDVAFLPSTSDAISAVANGLEWRSGDKVLVSVPDFPSVIYPWRALEEKGVEIISLPRISGRITAERVKASICEGARLLALGAVDFLTGFACGLEEIGHICKSKDILFCIDAIQWIGVRPIDVASCCIDFMAFGSHKWLLAPPGCGVLYINPELSAKIRPDRRGWKSVLDEEDFFNLQQEFKKGAAGLETGTQDILVISALGKAAELLLEIGVDRIWEKVRRLNQLLVHGLEPLGFEMISSPKGEETAGILTMRPPQGASVLASGLLREGIVVSERKGFLRFSPHFYNTTDEMEAIVSKVKSLLKRMAP